MIERLLNQSAAGSLQSLAQFTAKRHTVLAENVVNASTPGYRQKDLDESAFRSQLHERISSRSQMSTGQLHDLEMPHENPGQRLVFHDGNDRSMEQLMGDQANNALRHNLAVELLRKQFGLFQTAIRERVA